MKLLKTLTDAAVLGVANETLSLRPPRYTARAIVRNGAGLYAVMYAKKFDLYSLPGGGVEGEEAPITALKREVWEETGCTCDAIHELGIVKENRGGMDYTQESYYYIVDTDHTPTLTHLTELEAANGTGVQWHTLEHMVRLITIPVHATDQRKYLQARDVAALEEYLKHV